MNQHHHTLQTRTAVAKRHSNALPFLMFVLFLFLLSEKANAQDDGKNGEVRLERESWSCEEVPSTLFVPVRGAVASPPSTKSRPK